MRYLTVSEVIELYRQMMETSGGTVGILSIESLNPLSHSRVSLLTGKSYIRQLLKKPQRLGFRSL